MTTLTARQPKGIPVGGQFAATAHTEPSLTLSAPVVAPEYVEHRLGELGLSDHLNLDQINEVSARLNDSKDFTDRNIQTVADDLHLRAHGYTASQARDAEEGLKMLRGAGLNEQADALEAVTEARLANARGAAREESSEHSGPRPLTPPDERPDGVTVPVPADDPRVQAGQIFDKIQIDDQTFHRRREGVFPETPYAMRLQFSRPLRDAEKRQLAGLTGYAYASTIAGESLSEPHADSPYSFVVSADMTKSRRDDLGIALEEFEERLPAMIQEGSPVRTTNRSGPGTAGTRLVEGFNEPDLTFEIFYDEVVGEN